MPYQTSDPPSTEPGRGPGRPRCAIVVLGDLARSPRMRYHALSMARLAEVDLVGYDEAGIPDDLREHPEITVHPLPAPRALDAGRGSRIWGDAAVRLLRQSFQLLRLLLRTLPRPALVLVQSPPALPTLAVAWIAARLRRTRWIIDWHNLAFSVLALKLGSGNLGVRLARRYERYFGRRADGHLCVSRRLRGWLEEEWGLEPVRVLYDRPAQRFSPLPPEVTEPFLEELLGEPARGRPAGGSRPAVAVSPTSWTPDEDFDLLLAAVDELEARLATSPDTARAFPGLLLFLTGRGPLRTGFEERVAARRWPHVRVRTGWLSSTDYARLLSAADLGLSVHRSSSGLDLPMKVADMLGAGLPVCALRFGPVMDEQLTEGRRGVFFTSAAELAGRILELLAPEPGGTVPLTAWREDLRRRPVEGWSSGWEREARPLLASLLEPGNDEPTDG